MKGVACDLDSPGFHALCAATKAVIGEVKPYSITGSLPLIRDLKDAGFDVQTCGYGRSSSKKRTVQCPFCLCPSMLASVHKSSALFHDRCRISFL